MQDNKDLEKLRHSCSHILAQAVKDLWPEVKLGIGPAIENGFYYDFDKSEPFTDEDLEKIENRMQEIIDTNSAFEQTFVDKQEAIKIFSKLGETYKLNLIEEIQEEKISIYKTGDTGFFDLCKGPHVEKAGQIKAFKLLSIAGAYWKGDERNPQLQRIYGTCFYSKQELDEYLRILDEAQKRDHRKLGIQLGLFNFFQEAAGAGLVFYSPAGAMLRKIIVDYIETQHIRRGYELVCTPHILKKDLWEQSGHADYYSENMYFFNVDNERYAVKPMNCPGHMLIYKSRLRSWRDMPLRFFELGTVYRKEKAGVLHGLLRVRGFTQDDGHIFCRESQIKSEVKEVINFVFDILKDFGFKDVVIELSTRPEKFIGSEQKWEIATTALEESMKEKGLKYQIHEGEGAFYGPKIDIKLKDALQREWQAATIQCDFALPERFNLSYTNEEGGESQPIMIHRALLGSLERFIGTLIEHYAGAFPVWLAPTQAVIIPIKTEHNSFADKVKEDLQDKGIRVFVDNRNESLNKRIRDNTMQKIPYLLIVGNKEIETTTVSVRKYGKGDEGIFSIKDFILRVIQETKQKVI